MMTVLLSCIIPPLITIVIVVLAVVTIMTIRTRSKEWPEFVSEEGLSIGKTSEGYPLITGKYIGKSISIFIYGQGQIGLNSHLFTKVLIEEEIDINKLVSLAIISGDLIENLNRSINKNHVLSGHAEFDKRVTIKGAPEETIRKIIDNEGIRMQLLSLQGILIEIEFGKLTFKRPGFVARKEELGRIVDILINLYEVIIS